MMKKQQLPVIILEYQVEENLFPEKGKKNLRRMNHPKKETLSMILDLQSMVIEDIHHIRVLLHQVKQTQG